MRRKQTPESATPVVQVGSLSLQTGRPLSAPPLPSPPHHLSHYIAHYPATASSPPLIDCTDWADGSRGQRFDFKFPNEYPSDLTKKGPHVLLRQTEISRDGWRIEYGNLLNALKPLLASESEGVENYLDLDTITSVHQRDRELRAKRFQLRFGDDEMPEACIDGVMGKSLQDIFLYASTPILIAGTEHFLPTVVALCVEELFRTGLYQSHLFRKTPNFKRVEELIDVYDRRELPVDIHIPLRRQNQLLSQATAGTFGAFTSLHMETTENICALLRTFLQNLPEPILSPCLFNAIWNWCGIYRETSRFHSNHPSSLNVETIGGTLSSEELARIYLAQILLHLLPTPNFSLLVYLLSFFSQAIMVREENGLDIGDVGNMFGTILFGGTPEACTKHASTRCKTRARGDTMMRWFLRRWKQIYNGLFPDDDDECPADTRATSMTLSETSDDSAPPIKQTAGYHGFQLSQTPPSHTQLSSMDKELSSCSSDVDLGKLPLLQSSFQRQSQPSQSSTSDSPCARPSPRTPESQDSTIRYLEEVWPHLSPRLRMKLNERMVDILLEPLLSTHRPSPSRKRSNSVPLPASCRHSSPRADLSSMRDHAIQTQLNLAYERIGDLEYSARENQVTLRDALDENQRLKEDNQMLEMRMRALEVELKLENVKCKDIHRQKTLRVNQETVDGIKKQRDEARGVVAEIQRISGGLWAHEG